MEKTINDLAKDYAKLRLEHAKMKALLITFKSQFKDGEKHLFVGIINDLEIDGL